MARRPSPLFSYRKPSSAERTLRALRAAMPANAYQLVMRSDWRLYILATMPDGSRGYVARAPLCAFATGA